MPSSDIVMGSHGALPATAIQLTANAVTETVTVAAGSYYVLDSTASRSLGAAIETAFESHSEVTTCTVTLRENRKLRIAVDVAVSFAALSGDLGLMTGFTSASSSGTTQDAADPSSYMWVPGKCYTRRLAARGEAGLYKYDTAVGRSAPGKVIATQHYEMFIEDFRWQHVLRERTHVDRTGGEWVAFHRECLRKFFALKIYEDVEMDDTSTDEVTLGTPLAAAYVWAPNTGAIQEEYKRDIANIETYNGIRLKLVSTNDYS